MNLFTLHGLMSELTSPVFLILVAFMALFMIKNIFTFEVHNSTIHGTIAQFFKSMQAAQYERLWSTLSEPLKEALSNPERQAIAERGAPGVFQLNVLARLHQDAFSSVNPVILSKHRVSHVREGFEMIMVHTRHRPGGRGLTFWLSRSLHGETNWAIEEVLVHTNGRGGPFTLTGKRFASPKRQKETQGEALTAELSVA